MLVMLFCWVDSPWELTLELIGQLGGHCLVWAELKKVVMVAVLGTQAVIQVFPTEL